jgi:tripartite-type tricarboxylate transporter receptor subunit TctC
VPGGPSDFLSRLVGGKLSENLGQQIIPDNRGSAGGLVGFEMGAHATPDGYTFLMAAYSGYTINPHVYKQLPYKVSELQPITQLTLGGNIIIINPSVKAQTLKEFIALAKTMPGKMNYASTGTGPLLATERFKKASGIDLVNIPYKGDRTGPDRPAVERGAVLRREPADRRDQHQDRQGARARGDLVEAQSRPAGSAHRRGSRRHPGYENVTWHSFAFPAGVPRPTLKKMHAEIVKALNTPSVRDTILAQGLEPVGNTPEELSARIKKESAEYAKLVKDIGFQPQ